MFTAIGDNNGQPIIFYHKGQEVTWQGSAITMLLAKKLLFRSYSYLGISMRNIVLAITTLTICFTTSCSSNNTKILNAELKTPDEHLMNTWGQNTWGQVFDFE